MLLFLNNLCCRPTIHINLLFVRFCSRLETSISRCGCKMKTQYCMMRCTGGKNRFQPKYLIAVMVIMTIIGEWIQQQRRMSLVCTIAVEAYGADIGVGTQV